MLPAKEDSSWNVLKRSPSLKCAQSLAIALLLAGFVVLLIYLVGH